jgi:hypothetical protein
LFFETSFLVLQADEGERRHGQKQAIAITVSVVSTDRQLSTARPP